jgi:subtilisin family serine protease
MKISILLTSVLFIVSSVTAQKAPGWHLKDKKKGGYQGINLDSAYAFLKSKKIKSTPIIVAVIDSGIDTLHEDLSAVRWTNPKEKKGNGIDDDKNGYIDDMHGWNFLGGENGNNVTKDSYEGARVYHNFKSKYDGKEIDENQLKKYKSEWEEYSMWKRAKTFVVGAEGEEPLDTLMWRKILTSLNNYDVILKKSLGKESYTGNDLDAYTPSSEEDKKAKNGMLQFMKSTNMMEMPSPEFIEGANSEINGMIAKEKAKTEAPEDYRTNITGDNELIWENKKYGNNNLMVELTNATHGTHVSGIIAADRKNNKGVMGVADNVQIMTLRAVPDGDEHDKDIAYAIRYATDNGAKIINMSFGKSFSPQKKWVDDAVEYAQKKGVLLIHAAGNDGKNLDLSESFNFPNARLLNGKTATNWIEVGASGDGKLGGLAADFSNYGKKNVDVFAPGVAIYATVPGGNTYRDLQGTSMASPVTAGLAALIKSYFPKLTPEQIKTCIESTVVVIKDKVIIPGDNGEGKRVAFNTLSRTGGIINANAAVQAAYKMSGGK